jgi:hypothetical protein
MAVTVVSATQAARWNGLMARQDGSGNTNVLQLSLTGHFDTLRVGFRDVQSNTQGPQYAVMAFRTDPTAPTAASIDWTDAYILTWGDGSFTLPGVSSPCVVSACFLTSVSATVAQRVFVMGYTG